MHKEPELVKSMAGAYYDDLKYGLCQFDALSLKVAVLFPEMSTCRKCRLASFCEFVVQQSSNLQQLKRNQCK